MTPQQITSTDVVNIDQIVQDANANVPLVAVYCGSKEGKLSYTAAAQKLGTALVRHGFGLVYGGASIGVMGAVADAVVGSGGVAVGVIPNFLLDKEIAHTKLHRLYYTDTMHTRKALMAEFAAAFVVLPGGLGTLEELFEVATWRQLYQHQKPIILLNDHGFYDPLLSHLQHTTQQGFMTERDLANLVVCQNVDEVMTALQVVTAIDDDIDVEKF